MMITNRWKTAMGTALLAMCSYTAYAQADQPQGPPPGQPADGASPGNESTPRPDRELKMLTRVLTLTPDQQTGVKSVLEQQTEQIKALRDKAPADPSTGQTPETQRARMVQMEQIHNETDTRIAALLDENQKKTFADWVQRRKEMREQRRSRGEQPDGQQPQASPNE